MAVRVNSTQFAEKWGRRLVGATQDIRNGVERVSENPAEKAVSKQDKMLNNVTRAIQDGKWARGLARVTLADWKRAITEVGIPRIAAGVDSARGKVQDFAGDLIAHENRLLSTVEGMPDVTLEDNIARMTSWVRGMSEFVRS